MKAIILCIISLFILQLAMAQKPAADSLQKAKDDSVRWAKLESVLIYPIIKAGKWSGVVPVNDADEIPDPSIQYKLLFEIIIGNKSTEAKDINHGLTEVCRIINLHAASGIPVKNILPIILVHGKALFSFYTNTNYQKKYKVDNPNIAVVEELIKKTGARFIACGQSMAFVEVKHEDLIPQMKVSLTAKTVLSHYQLEGYKLYEIFEDKQ
jgi:intracellular sulfur oxidation DsrE/DsrF family protein